MDGKCSETTSSPKLDHRPPFTAVVPRHVPGSGPVIGLDIGHLGFLWVGSPGETEPTLVSTPCPQINPPPCSSYVRVRRVSRLLLTSFFFKLAYSRVHCCGIFPRGSATSCPCNREDCRLGTAMRWRNGLVGAGHRRVDL